MIKNFFKNRENPCICPKYFPICTCNKKPTFKNITKKVFLPSEKEIKENRRARSAKLRVAKKL